MMIARRALDALTRDPLMSLLLVTLACGLIASWSHLASVFALFYAGPRAALLGRVSATAIDGTLYVLALALGALARRGASTRRVYGGVVALLVISAAFNLDSALTALAGARPALGVVVVGVDVLDVARAVIGAATLPLVVAYLVHGYSTLAAARSAADPTPTAARRSRAARVRPSNNERSEALEALLRHALANPGATYRELGEAAGTSRQTAANWSRELAAAGRLERNGHGWTSPA